VETESAGAVAFYPDLSGGSLSVAAKHFFRHLHEPAFLRQNPIARAFFDDRSPDDLAARVKERSALSRIHQLVRVGADRCRDADIGAGKEVKALRQHAIVTLQCLERRPVAEVATLLGISYRHCYRERAQICRRIARYLIGCRSDSPVKYGVQFDEFSLLADQVIRRAALVDLKGGYEQCDALLCAAPSGAQKVQALRARFLVAIRFGGSDDAERVLVDAKKLWHDNFESKEPVTADVAEAILELMRSDLARYQGEAKSAKAWGERATRRLTRHCDNGAPYVRQLYAEALYNLNACCWNLGELEEAYHLVLQAFDTVTKLHMVPADLRARITVAMWMQRSHLLMSSEGWHPAAERVKGLTQAFEGAASAGCVVEAADALLALMEYYTCIGDDGEAFRLGRSAILMVQQQSSERLRAQLTLKVAIRLVTTKYWEYALRVVPSEDSLALCDSNHRQMIAYFRAERDLSLHMVDRRTSLFKRGGDNRGPFPALGVSKTILEATMADELERHRDARALLERAIPEAERLGSAPILRDAYAVAAKVTRARRFSSKAYELERLIVS
jgi:tetratricopeptide (TPR) repeat protein